MEVWLRRGFTEEQVRKGNYEEHPQLGPTYQLEIHDLGTSHEEGHEAVRQLDRVDHATQRIGPKRKAPDAAEPQLAVPAAAPQKKQGTDGAEKGQAQTEREARRAAAQVERWLAALPLLPSHARRVSNCCEPTLLRVRAGGDFL